MYYLVSVYENPIIVKKKTKITCYYLYIIANRKLHCLVCCRMI